VLAGRVSLIAAAIVAAASCTTNLLTVGGPNGDNIIGVENIFVAVLEQPLQGELQRALVKAGFKVAPDTAHAQAVLTGYSTQLVCVDMPSCPDEHTYHFTLTDIAGTVWKQRIDVNGKSTQAHAAAADRFATYLKDVRQAYIKRLGVKRR